MNEHRETGSRDEARTNEVGLDSRLRELALGYNEPPAVLSAEKREQMWHRIQETRGIDDAKTTPRPAPQTAPERSRAPRPTGERITQILWPVAAAAILLLGISIGRQTVDVTERADERGGSAGAVDLVERPTSDREEERGGGGPGQERADAVDRLAMARYLSRTEALLTEFRQAAVTPTPGMPGRGPGAMPPVLGWAGDLLLETRLLQDSRLSENPELRRLLNDLELILAQIVQLADEASPRERELIRESIERRSLLLRVREEHPAKDDLTGA